MTASGAIRTGALPQATWPAAGRVWFGGIDFHFSDFAAFHASSLPAEACDGASHDLPSAATVEARSPRGDAPLPRHGVRWSWSGERARLVSAGPSAQLSRQGEGRYCADGPDTADAQDFLTCLLWPALLREGGLVMHACAVEWQGQAVLFVGPSGAGKSTAATLLAGAKLLAKDVVSVFPARGALWVAPLPGGTPPASPMPPSAERCLPLGALLRVVQAAEGSRVQLHTGAPALSRAMGALRHGAVDTDGHQRMLGSAATLCEQVAVGDVFSVLGQDLAPALAACLEDAHG